MLKRQIVQNRFDHHPVRRGGLAMLAGAASAAVLGLSLLGVHSASADSILYQLGVGNAAISGFAGPYASVLVDRTSPTMATITFTSDTVGGNVYLLADGGSVAVNVDATSWTLGAVSGSNSGAGFTPGPYASGMPAAQHEDGFGILNQVIDGTDGFSHSADTVSFTITNTSGTWANAGNVLSPNGDGEVAAAHIFVTTSPAARSDGASATGFATVPEPGTFALAGLGMLGLAGLGRKNDAELRRDT